MRRLLIGYHKVSRGIIHTMWVAYGVGQREQLIIYNKRYNTVHLSAMVFKIQNIISDSFMRYHNQNNRKLLRKYHIWRWRDIVHLCTNCCSINSELRNSYIFTTCAWCNTYVCCYSVRVCKNTKIKLRIQE